MKCDVCGAPVENGKCTYCGKIFAYTDSKKDSRYHYERPKAVYVKSNTSVESSQKYKNSEPKQKKKISFKTIIFILNRDLHMKGNERLIYALFPSLHHGISLSMESLLPNL